MKFRKSKIWDDSFKIFFASSIMIYFIFSVDPIFMEKFEEQNGHYSTFWKNPKKEDFWQQISPAKEHPWFFFSEPIFVPYSRGAFWTLTFNLVIISKSVTWGDWDDEHWKKWSIFRPGWSILWTSDPFSDQARHQLNLNFSRLKMTNFQFFLAKYNLDIYIFNIYL